MYVCNDRCLVLSVACTAERFFRVDRAQEHLHYVSDVASDALYILEMEGGTMPQTPEDETALPSPSSNHQTPYIIPEMKVRYVTITRYILLSNSTVHTYIIFIGLLLLTSWVITWINFKLTLVWIFIYFIYLHIWETDTKANNKCPQFVCMYVEYSIAKDSINI